jgi:RNA polymerase sigma-70 factor (ECF subfamily)
MWIQGSSMDGKPAGVMTEAYDARLEQLRSGENDAWEELIAETQTRLYNYVLYNVPSADDAKDLLSEVYLAALYSISSLDSSSALLRWLYAIARHKIADFWHQARPVSELSDSLEDTSEGISLEFRETLAKLPQQTRQALLLRYHEGMSVEEVAHILGRSYKATESLLSRGRALLKAALDGRGTA